MISGCVGCCVSVEGRPLVLWSDRAMLSGCAVPFPNSSVGVCFPMLSGLLFGGGEMASSETCSGIVEETGFRASYILYPVFSTRTRIASPSCTPSTKVSMKDPSPSVVSWLALFPTTVTVAPSIGLRDCLSVTTPDIVSFFACAWLKSENPTAIAKAAAWTRDVIVCVVADIDSPTAQRSCRAAQILACLHGGEAVWGRRLEGQS